MRVNLITNGTTGVDMKSNPLSLGNKRLRAATNIVFDEGNVRSRYGYTYRDMGISGQFQGVGEYRPSRGASAGSFGEEGSFLGVVADGFIYIYDEATCIAQNLGEYYPCKGDVHVFQAENYLIFQNELGNTHWWDGVELTQSPGKIGVLWDDPEIECGYSIYTPPVAGNTRNTGNTGNTRTKITFINSRTKIPIQGVKWSIEYNANITYQGVGHVDFLPQPRQYYINASAANYRSVKIQPINLSVAGDYFVELVELVGLVGRVSECTTRNLYGFVTIPRGSVDLSAFFTTPVANPDAYRTSVWRLVTDSCGYGIHYNYNHVGTVNPDGSLNTDNIPPLGGLFAGLNPDTLAFDSSYLYPEGVYLQLGCVNGGVTTWPTRPCIPGGSTYEDTDSDGVPNDLDNYPLDPNLQ
jgi:hypothetical protein